MTYGIVVAKKNSNRFKNKNITDLNGYPLFWHSVKPLIDSDKVDKVFVINLEEEIDRKKHFVKELNERNIPFEIVNAVTSEDEDVKNLYRMKVVKSFPPCYRCKENKCNHENNYLAPKQCANFLSFKKIMEKIVKNEIQTTR